MANPTSNFNWQMPTPTDLVTDLPADFEVFGQAVDSSMADLLGGTTGQILAKNSNTNMDFVWIANDQGDITAVTAGTGISGGGTSGAVTITNSMATAIDAKGDLVAGTGADAFSRLAVGANDLVLTAASGEATGLKYSGAWTSWTPTFTNLTVGNGTVVARYCQVGKIVKAFISFTMGSTSSMGSNPFFTLPVTAVAAGSNTPFGLIYLEDAGVAGFIGNIAYRTTTTAQVYAISAGGVFLGGNSSLSSTTPFVWGSGDFFNGYFSYEAA